ncbi:hypothetical protein CRM22_003366 [Opisthorchis felineus]|uniref:4-hydroxybenzoate polyprenyltransferase, mitochondrial n=1 Tax=Opisthorchis felineus TaxID=147828 RepID=A0A4S2M7Q5_OPIFE|nr:hypothetical protein CRM22_003366 [Opisthorchis felineus]
MLTRTCYGLARGAPRRVFLLCSYVNRTFHLPVVCCPPKRHASSDMGRRLSRLPGWMDPYIKLARYDRPIGTWLLYLPCTWSIALASPAGQLPDLYMLTLFGIGAILMRGAGCTINDLLDRRFDQQVERTKLRPLANGTISLKNAFLFLGFQLSASLLILLQLNWYSIFLGLLSILPVTVYPLCKRVTYWPQIVLGLTLNWGTWLGYSAVVGYCSLPVCLPLYIGGTIWTTIYDTVYSHQDIEDDLNVGIKSLAIRLSHNAKPYFVLFQMGMLGCLLAVGVNSDAGLVYYFGTLLTMAHLAGLVYRTDLRNPISCLNTFNAGKITGLLYFTTIVLDKLLATGSTFPM